MSVNSGNYGRLLEPGLRKIFLETYNEKPEQYSQILNVASSQKAIETDLRMGGFSLWNQKGSLDATEYEDATTTDQVLYKHVTFSKGFQVEKEMVDDEQYAIINKMPKALARAARSTIETEGAKIFNTAFTANANNYKGEALIASNHVRLDGGTTTNLATGALNEGNLELALKLAHEQVDERGLKIQMNPDILIVPRALEYQAIKLMESTLSTIPGGATADGVFAKNDINAIRGRLKVVVLDYLDNPNAWFIADSQIHQLNWFWREKLSFKNDTDFDTDIAKYKGRMRFSYGWSDHRGIIGSTGV
jgi:phage major head subunit gpT-like protein